VSQVEQLIKKALSTTSDDEAVACLKQARKRFKGETVEVDADKEAGYEQLARKYHRIAYQHQQTAQMLRRELVYMNDTVIRWMGMQEASAKLARDAERKLDKEKTTNIVLKLMLVGTLPIMLMLVVLF
jgi:hypothetical protein